MPPIVSDVLRSPGWPLEFETRAFMESRFGHDFSGVRVHTDAEAAASAWAVNALAYTVGSHVVFGAGQYAPHSTEGKRVIAHELAHTIQQSGQRSSLHEKLAVGRSGDQHEVEADRAAHLVMQGPARTQSRSEENLGRQHDVQRLCNGCSVDTGTGVEQTDQREEEAGGIEVPITAAYLARRDSLVPQLQRLGDLRRVPVSMTCPVASTSPGSSGTSILFTKNSAALTVAGRASLSAVAAAWHAAGGTGVLRLDGYASVEGPDELNWRLSCDRATVVSAELQAPSDGSAGVPGVNIELFAQGETTEFSTALSPNRRVVITTSGGAPAPGPPCALMIGGLGEVDHYCEPYVPSDATSCGTFPAPNRTLTASGGAAGAVLRWSIVRGGARASIVGPSVGSSVQIQGTAPSVSTGDVTVQLTDGTCTVTRGLTVREPSTMTATQASTVTPTSVETIVTYTVSDQFGNAMGAGICWDETVTVCRSSHPGPMRFGDAATNASGQVSDHLRVAPVPSAYCSKLDQVITAGGCGPLLHNTILYQPSGVTLTHNSSCRPGDPCP